MSPRVDDRVSGAVDVSRHVTRARGASWGAEPLGCVAKLYGYEGAKEHAQALAAARRAEAAVHAAEPAAEVVIVEGERTFLGPDGRIAVAAIVVRVRVEADALAVIDGGPIHRKAIHRASRAASLAVSSWWEVDS